MQIHLRTCYSSESLNQTCLLRKLKRDYIICKTARLVLLCNVKTRRLTYIQHVSFYVHLRNLLARGFGQTRRHVLMVPCNRTEPKTTWLEVNFLTTAMGWTTHICIFSNVAIPNLKQFVVW